MIECVFTIDCEIYGNGRGSLRELVYEPLQQLVAVFNKWNARFVAFVEVAELEMIESRGTDKTVDLVNRQIEKCYREGFEIGLHLHPQWYNAVYTEGRWLLDYSEYNLCVLPRQRIVQIVERSLGFLRNVLGVADFTPISFRAGNWLFQPTKAAANVLTEQGIKVDSSVFKGGLQHRHKLDYRRALRNGYYWNFSDQVDVRDPDGVMIEIPTYTQMVPFWRMLTTKRIALQNRSVSDVKQSASRLQRLPDYLRLRYPLKFDFCRMTVDELIRMLSSVIHEDRDDPTTFRPIVAIGHTKDLTGFETVEAILDYLGKQQIPVSTFEQVYPKCKRTC